MAGRSLNPRVVAIPEVTDAPSNRAGMHSGVGGLAHVLAEIRAAALDH